MNGSPFSHSNNMALLHPGGPGTAQAWGNCPVSMFHSLVWKTKSQSSPQPEKLNDIIVD